MFLYRLNEEEKKAFLELAHYLARVDNNFMDKEKEIIKQYCIEMNIQDIEYDKNKFDLNKTLQKFKNPKSQKIVLLEIMALIYADNILHPAEKRVLNVMCKEFNINPLMANIYGEWSKAMMALYLQAESLINL